METPLVIQLADEPKQETQQNTEEVSQEQQTQEAPQNDTQPQQQEPTEPAQEQTTEETPSNSSLKSDTPQEQETEPQAQPASENNEEYSDQEFYSSIGEMLGLGDSFDSVEALRAAIAPKQQEPAYASEAVKTIDEFVRNTGRSVEEYFATQLTNYDEMDDRSVVKTLLKQQYGLTDEEADYRINAHYKLDPEEYSEMEVRIAQKELKAQADATRKEFKQAQEQYRLPVQKQQQEATQGSEELAQWENEMKQGLQRETKDLGAIEFEGGFEFNIPDEDRSSLESLDGVDKFFSLFENQNGQMDYSQMAAAYYLIENSQKIVSAAINHGASLERERLIKETKNTNFETKHSPEQPSVKKTDKQIIGEKAHEIAATTGPRVLSIKNY